MSRVASCAAALLWISAFACSSMGGTQQTLPPDCVLFEGPTLTIDVDRLARVPARLSCIGLNSGATDIVWTGSTDVAQLLVAFQRGGHAAPPSDPQCASKRCELDKSQTVVTVPTEYKYNLVVIRNDGTPKTRDPRLIILP